MIDVIITDVTGVVINQVSDTPISELTATCHFEVNDTESEFYVSGAVTKLWVSDYGGTSDMLNEMRTVCETAALSYLQSKFEDL